MRNLGRVERVFMVVPPLLAVLIAVLAPKLWPLHHIPGYWRPVVVLIGLGLDAGDDHLVPRRTARRAQIGGFRCVTACTRACSVFVTSGLPNRCRCRCLPAKPHRRDR